MKINEINIKNKEDLKDIYIHDTYITDMNIDYDNNKIVIDFESDKRCYKIIFENIIRFELYKLSLWAITHNQILDMYLDDYDIKQYINQKVDNKNYETTRNLDVLFTSEILVDNGDKISITCERVICIDLSRE